MLGGVRGHNHLAKSKNVFNFLDVLSAEGFLHIVRSLRIAKIFGAFLVVRTKLKDYKLKGSPSDMGSESPDMERDCDRRRMFFFQLERLQYMSRTIAHLSMAASALGCCLDDEESIWHYTRNISQWRLEIQALMTRLHVERHNLCQDLWRYREE